MVSHRSFLDMCTRFLSHNVLKLAHSLCSLSISTSLASRSRRNSSKKEFSTPTPYSARSSLCLGQSLQSSLMHPTLASFSMSWKCCVMHCFTLFAMTGICALNALTIPGAAPSRKLTPLNTKPVGSSSACSRT